MTAGGELRLAALAVAFAPRPAALLARLGAPGAADAIATAERLAGASRRERLRTLAEALAEASAEGTSRASRAEAAAALERPRVAGVIRALAAGEPPPERASPLVVRVCRDAIAGR